jgi:methyl-accepting chemotaxis protein
MNFLTQVKIGKRLLIIGAASLLGLALVLILSVNQLNSALRQGFNERTKQTLEVAYSQLQRFQAEEQAGRMTHEQAQATAKEAIRTMRFGKDSYFFILDTNYRMILHPVKPEKQGKIVRDEKDADGRTHYQTMVETALSPAGAGFVDYNFKLPDGSGSKPKISYVRLFKPWGWVVATGVFNSEINEAVARSAWNLAIVVVLILAALAAVILTISNSITAPLKHITTRMGSLAEGDTQADIPGTERGDELGGMARALLVFRDNAIAKSFAEAVQAKSDADQKAIVSLLSEKLEALSEGDLTSTLHDGVPADYVALSNNFNTALANLRDLIGVLAEGSMRIETGSHEIAAASDDLARRTESNAASLEETSAALSQMNTRLRSSAEAADRTVTSAQQAIGVVGSGRSTAEQATAAMIRVSDSARGIDSVIEGLDKIAFQTRVLAMNAAVEAGRAGEAGRGFAVVADLVSALAMRAEEEARRAREQLTATQTDIVVAVDAVKNVDSVLQQISGSVEQVHEFVESMASDNRAQSSTISEIASAVNAMDHSTQQNAAMVEQTSAAARNLAGEVATLSRQSARFNVGSDSSAGVRKPVPVASRSRPSAKTASPPIAARAQTAANADWASF